MFKKVIKNVFIIVTVILLIWFLRAQFVDVEQAMITVNVPGNSSLEELVEVLDVFSDRNVTGTFFIPGGWVVEHAEILHRVAAEHELACYTYGEKRLTPLAGEELAHEIIDCKYAFENVTGKEVIGFRAPANDVGINSYPLINEHYVYDSSVYSRYEWFWEEQPADLVEVPVTSVLVMPLDDWFGISVFRMNDLFFWLAKKVKQEPVVIAVTIGTVNEHLLDLEYLLAYYQQEGVNMTTIRNWVQ